MVNPLMHYVEKWGKKFYKPYGVQSKNGERNFTNLTVFTSQDFYACLAIFQRYA